VRPPIAAEAPGLMDDVPVSPTLPVEGEISAVPGHESSATPSRAILTAPTQGAGIQPPKFPMTNINAGCRERPQVDVDREHGRRTRTILLAFRRLPLRSSRAGPSAARITGGNFSGTFCRPPITVRSQTQRLAPDRAARAHKIAKLLLPGIGTLLLAPGGQKTRIDLDIFLPKIKRPLQRLATYNLR